MASRLDGGLPVVIGTLEYLSLGSTIGRTSTGMRMLIKRRATRAEFLAAAPEHIDNCDVGAPFYWELEMEEPS